MIAYAKPALTLNKNQAVTELFHKYRRMITTICHGYLKDWEEAKETAQEAFVKAYQGFDGFEGRCQPATWLTRIAINQCLSRLAARGRERRGMSAYTDERKVDQQEEREEEGSARVISAQVLDSADQVTRKILVLHFRDGLTHSQIAASLGVCRVAITRRISRFKRKTCRAHALPAVEMREAGPVSRAA